MRMRLLPAIAACILCGCAAVVSVPPVDGVDALLVGEQHDAAGHAAVHRDVVAGLARRGKLAALVLEMAERGAGTAGLPATASEDDVRRALRWDTQSWPWE
ncbi:MAG: hypothetical protein EOO24_48585, partial [Comamonadaceae bacterium]